MTPSLVPHDGGSDLDPRIDPRLMWPRRYLNALGFDVASSDSTVLHGDILRVDLVRGPLRVTVTWVPATEQIFVTQGPTLLGVYATFPELTSALTELVTERSAA